jgi:cystathionine beta-lyase/cystathionine gamma-synthase
MPVRERKRAELKLSTRAAAAGTKHARSAAAGGAFAPLGPAGESSHGLPLYLTSSFSYPDARAADAAAEGRAFPYSRSGNPTAMALEAALADLEGGAAALSFASGPRDLEEDIRQAIKR